MDNSEKNTFGRYLKKLRTQKGITLETVSRETRISVSVLALIEKEDHDNLPADVFVKGFIRAFAQIIGADDDKALQLYQDSLGGYKKKDSADFEPSETGSRFWLKILLAVGALCCLIVFIVWGISVLENLQSVSIDAVVGNSTEIQNNSAEVAKETTAPRVKETRAVQEKLLLDVRAVEKTWMRIQVDDNVPREYTLKAGERLALEAVVKIDLYIGNAAGVRLKLNDQPVKIKGKHGQVVSIQLPDDRKTE